jgi:hypothetical protein
MSFCNWLRQANLQSRYTSPVTVDAMENGITYGLLKADNEHTRGYYIRDFVLLVFTKASLC